MIADEYDIVVIGASVAAEAFGNRLRELGYSGELLVVDRDPSMPYERPPLSKRFLTSPEDTEIAVEWQGIAPVIAAEATGVDPLASTVELRLEESGETRRVRYGRLVIATGASPVSLPIEPEGVLRLRTLGDVERIRRAAGDGDRVGIIGAGAIGSELATSLVGNGAEVVLLDKADRPLERLLVGHLGADVASWLQAIGIDCRWGADIEQITGGPGDWTMILGDGSVLAFDALISAVGARPITSWLSDSGLLTDGQLVCDERGRVMTGKAVHETVFGIGDVITRQTVSGERIRTESWTAAAEHGTHLAETLIGREPSAPEMPYFWTDVAGRKIQVLGTLRRDGAIEVEFENPGRGAILYRVSGDDGSEGWIGVNAQPQIAMLRMAR
ncbi:FAD-dependent oxidoreductase [Leucobacter sp. gxy201]|uniref:NAD(P)/FAD-dependent oxidoreductase n=1 Tax=Leucobacter sp. gxy201 TaxID=2957200 RepID=UPI003DA108A7